MLLVQLALFYLRLDLCQHLGCLLLLFDKLFVLFYFSLNLSQCIFQMVRILKLPLGMCFLSELSTISRHELIAHYVFAGADWVFGLAEKVCGCKDQRLGRLHSFLGVFHFSLACLSLSVTQFSLIFQHTFRGCTR